MTSETTFDDLFHCCRRSCNVKPVLYDQPLLFGRLRRVCFVSSWQGGQSKKKCWGSQIRPLPSNWGDIYPPSIFVLLAGMVSRPLLSPFFLVFVPSSPTWQGRSTPIRHSLFTFIRTKVNKGALSALEHIQTKFVATSITLMNLPHARMIDNKEKVLSVRRQAQNRRKGKKIQDPGNDDVFRFRQTQLNKPLWETKPRRYGYGHDVVLSLHVQLFFN